MAAMNRRAAILAALEVGRRERVIRVRVRTPWILSNAKRARHPRAGAWIALQRHLQNRRAGFQPALRVEIHPQGGQARTHPSHRNVGHRKRTRCPRAVRRATSVAVGIGTDLKRGGVQGSIGVTADAS